MHTTPTALPADAQAECACGHTGRSCVLDTGRRCSCCRDAQQPAWEYTNGTPPEGAATSELETAPVADDAPDTTPRPARSVFQLAYATAQRAWGAHQARCVRCGTNPRFPCERGAALARRAADATDTIAGGAVAR